MRTRMLWVSGSASNTRPSGRLRSTASNAASIWRGSLTSSERIVIPMVGAAFSVSLKRARMPV